MGKALESPLLSGTQGPSGHPGGHASLGQVPTQSGPKLSAITLVDIADVDVPGVIPLVPDFLALLIPGVLVVQLRYGLAQCICANRPARAEPSSCWSVTLWGWTPML